VNSTSLIFELVRLARPVHWVKNAAIFAALIFGGLLFEKQLFIVSFLAFCAFNLAASGTYVFNDILDVHQDRLHPIKKNRPIAKGAIPISVALVYAATLTIAALGLAFWLSPIFALILLGYALLQIAYSLFLKNLHIIDILVIATGFVIRVYAGALVIDAHLSVWFLLCVISAALFLASGKRRAELSVVEAPGSTRKSLTKYSRELLNSYVTMFGNAAWMSWAMFTFFNPVQAETTDRVWLFLAELSRTTTVSKLLMITVPVTIFGIMRYQNLIFSGRAEAPERLLLTDKPLVISVVVWVLMVIVIMYGGFATF
jgi:decaprenyl-phosphate phosphoribosyltransferase